MLSVIMLLSWVAVIMTGCRPHHPTATTTSQHCYTTMDVNHFLTITFNSNSFSSFLCDHAVRYSSHCTPASVPGRRLLCSFSRFRPWQFNRVFPLLFRGHPSWILPWASLRVLHCTMTFLIVSHKMFFCAKDMFIWLATRCAARLLASTALSQSPTGGCPLVNW